MNLQMLKENRSLQIISIVIVCYVVIAIVFYFVAISLKLSTIRQISKKINIKKQTLNVTWSHERYQKEIEQARKEISELKSQIDYYEKMLPTEKEIPYLLQYLSQVAKETEVRLIQIEKLAEIKYEEEQTLYTMVPLALTLRGGYHNVGLFINKLENAERFIKVELFDVRSDETLYEHNVYLLLNTYMLWKE